MSLQRALLLGIVAASSAIALTACGSDPDSTGTVRAEVWGGAYIYAVKVRIDDERVVPCISRSGGGISCDWSVLHTPSPSPKPE